MDLKLTIDGDPVPKGRGRIMSSGNKRWEVKPARSRIYEDAIREQAFEAMAGAAPGRGAIFLIVCFRLPTPKQKTIFDWATGKPDLDNLLKSIMDGLNGVAWTDDSQVVTVQASKFYAEHPCVEIRALSLESLP